MKIKDMNTQVFFSKIGDLAFEISEICEDKTIEKILSNVIQEKDKKKVSPMAIYLKGAGNWAKLISFLCKDRFENVCNIISIMNDQTPEEIKNQPNSVTFKQLIDLMQDEDFVNLLPPQLKPVIKKFSSI